jgi:16S rRNA A1518/A1519 N6-dimethyltransferase RsmA/KsgA/DIM1 with predicted DNA glycosylase/AP lyase activity
LEILFLLGIVIVLLFSLVVIYGAPYLPTLSKRVDDAIELLELQPGQTMLELGSGDGRLLVAAAKKGIYSVGYELNPLLVIYSKLKSWKYRKYITISWGNYWKKSWPEADGMYVFLLNPYMSKLHKKVVQYAKNRKFTLVSFAFQMPEKEHSLEKDSMFQYIYNEKSR